MQRWLALVVGLAIVAAALFLMLRTRTGPAGHDHVDEESRAELEQLLRDAQ